MATRFLLVQNSAKNGYLCSSCGQACVIQGEPGDAQKGPLNGDDCNEPTNPCLKLMDALAKDGNVFELPLAGNYTR
jgi:hypothetical protein